MNPEAAASRRERMRDNKLNLGRRKPVIYIIQPDIEVVGEYEFGPYMRVRIKAHRLFTSTIDAQETQTVRRSRVVMTGKIGRPLLRRELVHHKDENRRNDHPDNLEIMDPAAHNREHKVGAHHTDEARAKISAGLRRAIAEGRRGRIRKQIDGAPKCA